VSTSQPAPTVEHLTVRGGYPREALRALTNELDELVADLAPVHLPSGASTLLPDEVAAMIAGRRRVAAAVYTPGGGLDLHSLGWLPDGDVDTATARIVAHLPGARIEHERPAGTHPQAVTVAWGSRTPGWSPTAVHVTRNLTSTWRERDELVTAPEAAKLVGIAPVTWRAYVARSDAGVPRPLGTAPVGPGGRTLDVWDRQQITAWHDARPGKGGRPLAPRAAAE